MSGSASHIDDRPLVRFASDRFESIVLSKTLETCAPRSVVNTAKVAIQPKAAIARIPFRLGGLRLNTIARQVSVISQLPRDPERISHCASTRHTNALATTLFSSSR